MGISKHAPDIPRWVDGALSKALSWEPSQRYHEVSEFVFDLSHPNPRFRESAEGLPLVQRHPVGFWKAVSAILAALCALLLYLLLTRP